MPKRRPPARGATVHLRPSLHHEVKMAAAHDGATIEHWIASALAAALARRATRPQVSRPHAVSQELRDLIAAGGSGR